MANLFVRISVVVPVYNTERYLKQCIDSVICQSFPDWEMILVDDGSTDSSGSVCDQYADNDRRIKVIHQKNSGISVARNVGIAKTTGEYIFLLDSDDYLPPNSLSDLIEVASSHNRPDYIKGNHQVLMPDGRLLTTKFAQQRKRYDGEVLDTTEFLSKVILTHPVVWNGLIKRSLFQNCNLAFDPDACFHEDLVFNLSMARCKLKGMYTSKITYVYRYAVANSASNSLSLKIVKSHICIMKAIIDCLVGATDSEFVALARQELVGTVNLFFKLLPRIKSSPRNEYIRAFRASVSPVAFELSHKQQHPLTKLYRHSPFIYSLAGRIIYRLIPKQKRIH